MNIVLKIFQRRLTDIEEVVALYEEICIANVRDTQMKFSKMMTVPSPLCGTDQNHGPRGKQIIYLATSHKLLFFF